MANAPCVWIPNSTNTHSEYVIVIASNTHSEYVIVIAFQLEQLLQEFHSMYIIHALTVLFIYFIVFPECGTEPLHIL
jgi:hypothetical protein